MRDQSFNEEGRQFFVGKAISILSKIKILVDSGFVILTSQGTGLDLHDDEIESAAKQALNLPEIMDGFNREERIYQKPSYLPGGENAGMIQLLAVYQGWRMVQQPMATYFPPGLIESGRVQGSVMYDFINPFSPMSRHKLEELGKKDMLDGLTSVYSDDAKLVISAIHSANEVNTPGLFLRHVDFDIAQTYASGKSGKSVKDQIDGMEIYKSILPYVSGISPEQLIELRQKMPEAFKDFRGLIFRLYQEAKGKGFSNAETKAWIDDGVNSLLRHLDIEMKNATRKARLKGIGSILGFLKGSLSQSLDVAATYDSEKRSLTSNPTFFLWKAKR